MYTSLFLPKYRGASPVQHAILNGDEITGVTFYILDEKMDTGDRELGKLSIKMIYKETYNLFNTLFEIASKKLPEIIQKLILGKKLISYPKMRKMRPIHFQRQIQSIHLFSKKTP